MFFYSILVKRGSPGGNEVGDEGVLCTVIWDDNVLSPCRVKGGPE